MVEISQDLKSEEPGWNSESIRNELGGLGQNLLQSVSLLP